MKRPPDKDLYAILGIAPDATPEEIREAHLARMRVIHPDRFDRQANLWFRDNRRWDRGEEPITPAASDSKNDACLGKMVSLGQTVFQHISLEIYLSSKLLLCKPLFGSGNSCGRINGASS
jgi:hypothetical protein